MRKIQIQLFCFCFVSLISFAKDYKCKRSKTESNIELAYQVRSDYFERLGQLLKFREVKDLEVKSRSVYFFDHQADSENREFFFHKKGIMLRVRLDKTPDEDLVATSTLKIRSKKPIDLKKIPESLKSLSGFKVEADQSVLRFGISGDPKYSVSLKVERKFNKVERQITKEERFWPLFGSNQLLLLKSLFGKAFVEKVVPNSEKGVDGLELEYHGPIEHIRVWEKKIGDLKVTLEEWPFPILNSIVELSTRFPKSKKEFCTLRFMEIIKTIPGSFIKSSKTSYALENFMRFKAQQDAQQN